MHFDYLRHGMQHVPNFVTTEPVFSGLTLQEDILIMAEVYLDFMLMK